MEVHTHTHTPRKKWLHYFYEFLMLFLAVFCGFLAEYKLEHTIEHQRAKIYVANLYDELKKDTTRLEFLIHRYEFIRQKLDTFCMYANDRRNPGITNGMLYYYGSFATSTIQFSPQNVTIEQLKGSGNLRLLDADVAHNVSIYDRLNKELEKDYILFNTEFQTIEQLHFRVFDVYQLETVLSFPDRPERDSVFRMKDLPLTSDPLLMTEYTGWIKHTSTIYNYQAKVFLEPIKEQAVKVLQLLEQQYDLK